LVVRAKRFATEVHEGQRYGEAPYTSHLSSVVQVLVDAGVQDEHVLAAGWLHDVLEDTDTAPMGLVRLFGVRVMWLVQSCTGEGRTRKERIATIYRRIRAHPDAAIVKLADRIANVEAAGPGSRHLDRYRNEQRGFADAVRSHVPPVMWQRLERALRAEGAER
jgi:(p)ppGpp synthase/HD superfamily hydrolase